MPDCCELLIAEHRHTETLVNRLQSLLTQSRSQGHSQGGLDWLAVRKAYRTLADDLHRHFTLEEQALFTVLSQYRTMMLMEVEHDDLLTLQADFAAGLMSANPSADVLWISFEAFKQRLFAHMKEEEQGIFPLAEAKLEPEEKIKVLRLYQDLLETYPHQPHQTDGLSSENNLLKRAVPGFQIASTDLFNHFDKPMAYQTLYERENTTIQHICLQAGQKQTPHWAGQNQCVLVLSGQVVFESAGESHTVVSGDTVTLDSRLVFAFSAVKDTQLLVFKVWPHPHYSKS